MKNKLIIFILITLVLVVCSQYFQINCPHRNGHNVDTTINALRIEEYAQPITHCQYCLKKVEENISSYKKFQTFDEYKMKGVGKALHSPYVYVRKVDENTIHVKMSNNIDSTICYTKYGDTWINIICDDLWKSPYPCTKNGESIDGGPPATIHSRYIKNDTIIEVRTTIIENEESSVVFVKTKEEMFTLSSLLLNKKEFSADSICMICKYYTEAGFRDLKKYFPNYRISRMKKVLMKDSLKYVAISGKYNQNKEVFAYKLNSLGEYGSIPGIEKFAYSTYQLISDEEIKRIREQEELLIFRKE